ncbi:MAG: hypothetical protein AAFN30_13495 [Actinomycetota bacterium]
MAGGSAPSVRGRDHEQAAAAAAVLNRSVRRADATVAACSEVLRQPREERSAPLVTLEPPTATTLDITALAQGATDEDLGRGRSPDWKVDRRRRDLDAFLSLLDITGVGSTITRTGSFTLLVPPAEESEKLAASWRMLPAASADDEDTPDVEVVAARHPLVEQVRRHLLDEQLSGEELEAFVGDKVRTMANDLIAVGTADGNIRMGEAEIWDRDVLVAGNGTVHLLNPKLDQQSDTMSVLLDDPDTNGVLLEALMRTGLDAELDRGPYTLFVQPTTAPEVQEALASGDAQVFLSQWMAPGHLTEADLRSSLGTGVETDHGRILGVEVQGDSIQIGGTPIAVKGGALAFEQTASGAVYWLEGTIKEPEEDGCEPRAASIGLLRLLRDELIGAGTRTSNAGAQQQLADRVAEVDAELAARQEAVAVHRLVIDGADSLVGESIAFTVNDDVAARLGGWGWVVLAVGLVIAYRRLEIINGHREAGPIRVLAAAPNYLQERAKADMQRASAVIANTLGQAELREPSSLPGGETTRHVAELLQAEGMPGGQAAQAIATFLQNTVFPAKGVVVEVSVERVEGVGQPQHRVTVRVNEARNGRLLYSQPFLAADLDEAAEQAAAFVAVRTLADSRTTPPWATWPDDDGTGLRAYQEVALDERTRETRLTAPQRRDNLRRAVAACPYAGLARVGLGQHIQLVGPLAGDLSVDDLEEPSYERAKHDIGRALVTGSPHLIWATEIYPNFLIARYRLAATLSMLSEDVQHLWLYDQATETSDTGSDGAPAHLSAAEVSAEIADMLSRPAPHRRSWWGRAQHASGGVVWRTAIRSRLVAVRVLRRCRNALPFMTNTEARVSDPDRFRTERLTITLPEGEGDDRKESGRQGEPDRPSGEPADLDQVIPEPSPPSSEMLLTLATNEVKSGRWALTWYPWIRVWRQSERSYWLAFALHRNRRRREQAAFRILGEIIDLRKATLDKPITAAELDARCTRIIRLQSDHRDDAITCYAAASFHGVALDRVINGWVGDLGRQSRRKLAADLAQTSLGLVRDARAAANGFLISTRWLKRDPDFRALREHADPEWRRLIRRLEAFDNQLS